MADALEGDKPSEDTLLRKVADRDTAWQSMVVALADDLEEPLRLASLILVQPSDFEL